MAIIRICQFRKKEKLNFALSIHKEERMVISDYVVEKKKKKMENILQDVELTVNFVNL